MCGNSLAGRVEAFDEEVLTTLQEEILRPRAIERAIEVILAEYEPGSRELRRD